MANRVPIGTSASEDPFSPRQREVVRLVARGLDVAQIARVLFTSESTTRSHLATLYEKLGATTRAEMLLAAGRRGLLDDDDGGAPVRARPSPRPPLPPRAAALDLPSAPPTDRAD